MTVRVLYLDGVGPFGGASRSLFEAVRALPEGSVEPYFVTQQGTVVDFYGQLAKGFVSTRGLTRIDNSRYSHYRGVRWLILLRELFYLPFTLAGLLKARRLWRHVDLIHQNEVMEILPGLIARRLFGAPLVVHVRSLQRVDERSLRTSWINNILRCKVAAVIAINENTRATLPADMAVDVIQNSFTPLRSARPDPVLLSRLGKLRPSSLKVGFVGNLHHSKGLFDLLDAARIIREMGRDVEFVIVGGVTIADTGLKGWALAKAGLAQNVQAELTEQITQAGLQDTFHLIGATTDIQCVYDCLDVIAFPSHYDAPGRPVFEAAFSGVPAIVSVNSPKADTLVQGQTGLAIPARNPRKLAEAILHFADDRSEVERMGARARELAQANFVPAANARKLLALYERVVAAHRSPSSTRCQSRTRPT